MCTVFLLHTVAWKRLLAARRPLHIITYFLLYILYLYFICAIKCFSVFFVFEIKSWNRVFSWCQLTDIGLIKQVINVILSPKIKHINKCLIIFFSQSSSGFGIVLRKHGCKTCILFASYPKQDLKASPMNRVTILIRRIGICIGKWCNWGILRIILK